MSQPSRRRSSLREAKRRSNPSLFTLCDGLFYFTRHCAKKNSLRHRAAHVVVGSIHLSDSRRGHALAFSRHDRPELSWCLTLADEAEGAGNAGCQHAPMGPEQQKAREVGPQVRPGDPGVPRAVGLRLIRALPGETGLVCHRLHKTRERFVKRHLPLGRQACTISPSAIEAHSSRALLASTASRTQRP